MELDQLALCRVDQVGSLLRPAPLKDAFLAFARGELDAGALRAEQDRAILAALRRQEAAGLPVATDGEFRRLNWQVSFSEVRGWDLWTGAWENFRRQPANRAPGEAPLTRGADAVVSFRTKVSEPLALTRSLPLEEYRFASAATRLPVKAMLMGPDRVVQMSDYGACYETREAYLADVLRVQREMVAGLVQAGCRYVQLDEPSYTGYVDPPSLARMREQGEDPAVLVRRAVDADNAVIEGLPGAVFGLHVCRGNRASMWHREGHYDAIAEAVFGGLRFHRLLLEYDSERAGGFEPLRYLRPGTVAVLGLVTTKSGRLETVDELRRRIDEAARHVPLERLAISPQCGFASGIAGNQLTEDEQWRKLELLLETARRVWG